MLATMPLDAAARLGLVAAGVFFLSGLLTGVWKYAHIARAPAAVAPMYVDIAHRASLLYSFAALLLAQFAALSAFPPAVNLIAVALPLAFFTAAIGGYVIHGIYNETDNQFRAPHRLAGRPLPAVLLHGFMFALLIGEVGGFLVLFAGVLVAL